MQKIVICIKQVPATEDVKIDPIKGILIRKGIKTQLNPVDLHALEAALSIKERSNKSITTVAISMGPPEAREVLQEALNMGIDEGILLSDEAFAGADTLATAYTLSCAIRKIAPFNLIICGKETIDGDTGQVGPQLAQLLQIPYVTYVSKIIHVEDDTICVERILHDGIETLEVKLPALITVLKELNNPRMPNLFNIFQAKKKIISVWNKEDVSADEKRIGLLGSPTQVVNVFAPLYSSSKERRILEGSLENLENIADELINELKERNLLT